jgi:hypothetical protein
MTIEKVVTLGLVGNELSKRITGSDEVSTGRTAVAVGAGAAAGAAAGAVAGGAMIVTVGVAAPITVPLALGSAVVAGIASLFD